MVMMATGPPKNKQANSFIALGVELYLYHGNPFHRWRCLPELAARYFR